MRSSIVIYCFLVTDAIFTEGTNGYAILKSAIVGIWTSAVEGNRRVLKFEAQRSDCACPGYCLGGE